jgi:hypothetical protein
MEYPRYNGHYVGIVVQNNDPQYRGRVKVFVPHISPTVYKSWNEINKDKNFNFIGDISTLDPSALSTTLNTVTGTSTKPAGSGDLTVILEDLKKILPWAEMAAPLAGGGSSGRYNATTGYGSVSDSNNLDYTTAQGPISQYPHAQNLDNIGEKPGNVYDIAYNKLSDAFTNPQLTNVNNVNRYSYDYVPETYSNSAKGAFPILNVGAHVWVFFNEGDPLKPVIFGLSYGANDWTTITGATPETPGIDYPGTYENIKKDDSSDINARTYRNKYVINQKGGTLSFNNTDTRETVKITHYSGSFKEFNNQTNIELATGNDQKLVLGDTFSTVRGYRNEFTQRDLDNIIVGDHYRKVGNLQFNLFNQWKKIMESSGIPNIKQLFDIQRTTGVIGIKGIDNTIIKLNGKGQTKNGTPYLCPLCSANEQSVLALNNTFGPEAYSIISKAPGYSSSFADSSYGHTITDKGVEPAIAFGNELSKLVTGIFPIHQLIENNKTLTDQQGKTLVQLSGTIGGIPCPVCNPASPFNSGIAKNPVITLKPGYSPSSFHGAWSVEPQKKNLVQLYQQVLPKLAQIEAQMGPGGSEIIEVTKHKIETIGMVMNDWGAIRVDPIGKLSPAFVAITPYMPVTVQRPTPLIEQVQVDDLPGGTYTLNVCNRYNVLVGAGGLNLKSYGVVNISGSMANIAAEQVNIGSANEVNIDGGSRLSLVGDIVSIRQRNNEQILMDSSVGITGNLIVKGGIFVEGNLTALSTSTPQVKRVTDQTKVTGRVRADATAGVAIPMDTAGKLQDGQLRPDNSKYLYMGYTDPGQSIGWVPKDLTGNNMAIIPAGTTINISSISGIKDSKGGDCVVSGTASITTSQDIKVYSSGFAVRGTGPAKNGGSPDKINKIIIDEPTNVMSLRGLPNDKVTQLLTQAQGNPGDKASTQSPFMVIGAGAHPDGVVNNPHSHTHNEGDAPAHAFHRAEFASQMQNGNVPTKSEPHGHSTDQNIDTIKQKFTSFLSALQGGGGGAFGGAVGAIKGDVSKLQGEVSRIASSINKFA